MERKEITAFLIDCKPDDFMAYADQGEAGTVVVGPDGKKYRFSVDQLEKTETLMKEDLMKLTLAEAAAPGAASGTRKEPAPPAQKRKPAAKPRKKPPKKPGTARKIA